MNIKLFTPTALLLILTMTLAGCTPSPQSLADDWQAALNRGDLDKALSYLSADAVVSISPPGPDGDGVYQGRAEVRKWYESLASANGAGSLKNCKTEGEALICISTYTDNGLKEMGVDFIEGEWKAVIKNGKIQSYTFAITPESLAKFPPPPTAAASGGETGEVQITDLDRIIGKWEGKNGDYTVLHDFQPGGALTVKVLGVGLISRGQYWFDNGLLKIEDQSGDCMGMTGSYEVFATYEDDLPVQLRFVLSGDDPCTDRRKTLDGNTMKPLD